MLSPFEKEFIRQRGYWTLFKPLALFYRHRLEMALTRALRREGLGLEGRRLLEDGCGEGNFLRQLVDLGATPGRCVGVDRDPYAAQAARHRTPASFAAADAGALPFHDGTFDVVAQSLLFSSLPPGEARRRAAAEVARVLADDGVLIWYDFVESAKEGLPRGLELADVAELFPGWTMRPHKFGLRFRWALFLVNKSLALAHALASLGLARSHYIILLRKPAAASENAAR